MENNHGTYISSKKYIPQLDGIRGLAILLVITYHYFGFLKIFSFGWTGVDLFFVLSGYLITSRLVDNDQINHLSKFYRNRTLRIFPVYFFTLIGFYIAFNVFTKGENFQYFKYYNTNWYAFVLFCQNWLFVTEVPVVNHLQHFWSLAIEEQFYLIWPLFLYVFVSNKHLFKILFLIIIFIIVLRSVIYFSHPAHKEVQVFFYNTFCRMDGFIVGALLFFAQKKNSTRYLRTYFWIAFFILITGLIFTDTHMSNPFTSTLGLTLVAIVCAGIINSVTRTENISLISLFSQRWLTLTGKISYGLYIYHWIILRSLHGKLLLWMEDHLHLDQPVANFISLFFCLAISFIISLASYFYFESYFLKLKRK